LRLERPDDDLAKKTVYSEEFPEFHHWVNSYIELRGMHRFKKDPEWGECLARVRDGTLTVTDIEYIVGIMTVQRHCSL
jgi:hypothetical protein